jgi:hypothetical protein
MSYEHCFALDWEAMKGYHYLMRLAHVFNTLTRFSSSISHLFKQYGIRGFIVFSVKTLSGPWFSENEINDRLKKPYQLRLL